MHLPRQVLPEKSLFRLTVDDKKLHLSFQDTRLNPAAESSRRMIDDVFQEFRDLDGNFVEQFQTTGFDARLFELYLFAYFSRTGFSIDNNHAVPDFLVERDGHRFALEVTTLNPPRSGVLFDHGRKIDELDRDELRDYFENEIPIRFGSPIFSKLKKRYWEKPQCKGLPFVIAIEAFHEQHAQAISDTALIRYLYGRSEVGSWDPNGKLVIDRKKVESHSLGGKTVPSGFFSQPEADNISAIVFTNSGTVAKFARMGFQQGYGIDAIEMERAGFWFTPDEDAMDWTYMHYNLYEPPCVESWGQGLVVLHNPNAKIPLKRTLFPDAVHGYEEDEAFVTEVYGWHPTHTNTFIFYLGPDKKSMAQLPWRRSPRLAVGPITKADFEFLCPQYTGVGQHGWYADETCSFLGVICFDPSDRDWTCVVLARDEHFIFRAIDVQSSILERAEACRALQMRIASRLTSPQRVFPNERH